MSIRIGILLQDLGGGGAEKMMVNIANELSERPDIIVDLILIKNRGNYFHLINDRVNVIHFNSSKIYFGLFPLVNYKLKMKPHAVISTIVHINILNSLTGLIFPKIKTVLREANSVKKNRANNLFLVKLSYALLPVLYKYAHAIVAISEGLQNELIEIIGSRYAEKIYAIHNPVLTQDLLSKVNQLSNLRRGATPQQESFRILSVGRLAPQKDHETLIRAFSRFSELNPNVNTNLVIAGDGPQKEFLQALSRKLGVSDRIHFLGFIEDPITLYSEADLFVFPSKYEGFGNVLAEAVACKINCIAANCQFGPSEIFAQVESGCAMFEVGDFEALAELITIASQGSLGEVVLKQSFYEAFGVQSVSSKYLKLCL